MQMLYKARAHRGMRRATIKRVDEEAIQIKGPRREEKGNNRGGGGGERGGVGDHGGTVEIREPLTEIRE